MSEQKLVLVVCQGNVCRSPLAEAVISKEIGAENVASRGFGPSGLRARGKIREYALRQGYNLEKHRSTKLACDDLLQAAIVLYMSSANAQKVHALAATCEAQGYLLECLAWYNEGSSIPDPVSVPAGPELDRILTGIVAASRAFAKQWLSKQKSLDPRN